MAGTGKCIFNRWEAIDLFVKIISKYEKIDRQIVDKQLISYLGKYKRATKSAEVANDTLKLIADRNFGSQNYYPSFLSDLSEEITNGVPKVRTANRVELMLEYVGERSQIHRYQFDNQNDHKRESLAGTYWWLYTHEYYVSKQTNKKVMCVTCDAVSLNSFGHVTMIATKNHEGANVGIQNFTGQYYTKNNRYLFLDLRISEINEKDFRCILDIGTGHTNVGEVFTGYYVNASNNLYFGPVLFERINKPDDFKPQLFEKHGDGLDEYIWSYFDGLNSIPYKVLPSYGSRGKIDRFVEPDQ